MNRLPYLPPVTELLPVGFDNELCVITTSTEPYNDNGNYDWGA